MTKNPLFSTYRQGENRVTASMLAVFERIDSSIVERLLAAATGESALSWVSFANQVADKSGSVPDAAISASFRYLFEVKTEPQAVRKTQLIEHLKHLGPSASGHVFADERLFVVTPDAAQPAVLAELGDPRVLWFNFLALSQAIDEVLADPTELISEQGRFLLRELQSLFVHDGLLDHQDVVIVAARFAYTEYKHYGAYICQTGRSFRLGITRLGFYMDGAIQPEVPEILGICDPVEFTPEDAHRYAASDDAIGPVVAQVIDRVVADGARADGQPHKIFLLSAPDDPRTLVLAQPVRNTKRDHNGQLCAWVQGQRYTRAMLLRRGPATTDELDDQGG
jgi:hypothetical protein